MYGILPIVVIKEISFFEDNKEYYFLLIWAGQYII